MGLILTIAFLASGFSLFWGIMTLTDKEALPDEGIGTLLFGMAGGIAAVAQLVSTFSGEPGPLFTSLFSWGALAAYLGGLAIVPVIAGIEQGFKFLSNYHEMTAREKMRSKEKVLGRMNEAGMKAAKILEAKGVDSTSLIDAVSRICTIIDTVFVEREVLLKEGGFAEAPDPKAIIAEANELFDTDSSQAAASIATQLERDIKQSREWVERSERAIELALAHCLALPVAASAMGSGGTNRAIERLGEVLKTLPRTESTSPVSGLIESFQTGAIEREILSTLGVSEIAPNPGNTRLGVSMAAHETTSPATPSRGRTGA